jgi:SRSO17 transposase
MTAEQLRSLRPALTKYLGRFADCFSRSDTRAHLSTYVQGQLSDLPQKSVEPIALRAGTAPRTLQEFLAQHRWDQGQMRDRLQHIVRDEHGGTHSIGLLDETSFKKQGDKTPGVKRQWCGTLGKKENCTVTVHLGYSWGDFHCLLDGELFLPEDWSADRQRCREAGIPDSMVYRPKWQIGLELYDHAIANGVSFEWLTFDEGYGSKPDFLRGLTQRLQPFVGEVPRSFTGWVKAPQVVRRPYHRRGRGRGRKIPRLAANSPKVRSVEQMLNSPPLRNQRWRRLRVKDTQKGPAVWEVKHTRFYPKDENGLPAAAMPLIVARNALDLREIKFFVSNAPALTPIETLVRVGFSRWPIERCFEDQKSEVGLDHYEGRRYVGLKRHLTLSMVSHLFLARSRQDIRGEKSGPQSGSDRMPDSHGIGGVDPVFVVGCPHAPEVAGPDPGGDQPHTTTQRTGPTQPHQTYHPSATRTGDLSYRNQTVPLAGNLAL